MRVFKSIFKSAIPAMLALSASVCRADTAYVVDAALNNVRAYAPDGSSSVFATGNLINPVGLAFDSAGNLYVSSFSTPLGSNGMIVRFTPGGGSSVFANTGLN